MGAPLTERDKMQRFNARNQLAAQLLAIVTSNTVKSIDDLTKENMERIKSFAFDMSDSVLDKLEAEAPDSKVAGLALPKGA